MKLFHMILIKLIIIIFCSASAIVAIIHNGTEMSFPQSPPKLETIANDATNSSGSLESRQAPIRFG